VSAESSYRSNREPHGERPSTRPGRAVTPSWNAVCRINFADYSTTNRDSGQLPPQPASGTVVSGVNVPCRRRGVREPGMGSHAARPWLYVIPQRLARFARQRHLLSLVIMTTKKAELAWFPEFRSSNRLSTPRLRASPGRAWRLILDRAGDRNATVILRD
jgi:hypothetical protein